ncbi:TetR family transcriptional regulator [Rhodococcoides trifolii]|uniref:TetR family transcriptional regulator n=1 Tax=Rhodococcoides trifolii TaxID=908250 RepID=A0A917CS39_9NOCA|nr:TetR/AcrR family transcriptional regulator [Rhodococcus trifolii]GGF95921.1 TetR family transcriptional regulator [Rhodococcus trifolii]
MANKNGRARDTSIDDRILAVAARHLAEFGYDGMSVHGVAADAGTTRQALYRRWATKAELAAAVVAQIPRGDAPSDDGDPFLDLVSELGDFRSGVSRPGRMSLVGTMLQDGTDDDVRARYRERVVAPRRARIRAILERGEVAADADLDIVVTMATGSWYARALAGEPVPDDWAERTAAAVWRAAGGVPA